MDRKAFLVVNPCSGKAKARTKLLDIVSTLSLYNFSVTVYPTKERGDATKVASTLDDKYDTVICCGGDGTLNEVITGLMQNKNKYLLGYIPAGTLNEWSSGLNISRNMIKAATDIATGSVVPLDIGRFDDKYFSYTASFGAFTEASWSAPQDIKNVLGQAAYFFEGIKSVGNIKPIPLKLVIDGQMIEGNYLFGSISNSLSVGGVVHFSENAVGLADGVFEVLLIKSPSTLADLNDILDGLLKKDLNRKNIEFIHAKRVEVYGGDNIKWTLDGECALGKNIIVAENIHHALSFIVPNKTAKRF